MEAGAIGKGVVARVANLVQWTVVCAKPMRPRLTSPVQRRPLPGALHQNAAYAIVGNAGYGVIQWLMLVVLVRLGSPEIAGVYVLALAIAAPIMAFFNLQLRALLASESTDSYPFSNYLTTRIATTVVALLVVLCVAAVIRAKDQGSGAVTVILAVGLAKGFESVSDIYYGLMQRYERMDQVMLSLLLHGALALITLIVVLRLTHTLLPAVACLAAVWCAVLLAFDRPRALGVSANPTGSRARLDGGTMIRLVIALPLGVVSALMSYTATIPRYYLAAFHGQAALGYFGTIAYLQVAITTIIEATGQSAAPRLAREFARDRRAFRFLLGRLLLFAIGVGAAGTVIAAAFGAPILELLYRPDFAVYSSVFVTVMAVGTLLAVCSILGVALMVARVYWTQLAILLVVIATDLIAARLLIPRHGAQGAAWAWLTASAVWVVLDGIAVLRTLLEAATPVAVR